MTNTTNTIILYVDDDTDDCLFLQKSLEETGSKANLVCASSGEEAVHFLNTANPSALPQLIVLDLNMPKWDGRRTLQYLKSQPHLATIPVVILSTSENQKEREVCQQMGAVSCFKKPYRLDEYRGIVDGFMQHIQGVG